MSYGPAVLTPDHCMGPVKGGGVRDNRRIYRGDDMRAGRLPRLTGDITTGLATGDVALQTSGQFHMHPRGRGSV